MSDSKTLECELVLMSGRACECECVRTVVELRGQGERSQRVWYGLLTLNARDKGIQSAFEGDGFEGTLRFEDGASGRIKCPVGLSGVAGLEFAFVGTSVLNGYRVAGESREVRPDE